MKPDKKYIDSLVKKVISETLEDKADSLVSKIKSEVKELGGMDDVHPKFGKLSSDKMKELSQMSDDELRDYLSSSDEDEMGDEEDIEMSEGEMDEGFDDYRIKYARFKKDYDPEEFAELPKGLDYSFLDDDSMTPQEFLKRTIKRLRKRRPDLEDNDELMSESSEVCECGGKMYEGECMECGYMSESYHVKDLNKKNKFDYVEEEFDDSMDSDMDMSGENISDDSCKYHMENFGPNDERTKRYCGTMNESLKGRQKVLDKNKNNKIDAEDFKLLRKSKKTETKEEKKFIQKAMKKMEEKGTEGSFKKYCGGEVTMSCIEKAMKSDDPKLVKKANFAKNIKAYKGAEHKESVKLTENELIDLIEKIVIEQKVEGLKTIGKPKGLTKYEQVHKADGKENQEYLKSVVKKMKEYLKDGSKGDFDMEPKMFPKGNGELAKMKKKAYVPSDAVKDYTDNLTAAALENLDYDEIHPNEEWVSDNVVGSSRTGNNPKWANAVETDVNEKRNKVRKDNLLGKIKRKAYNKAPQPIVTDKTGEDASDKLMTKLESVEPKETKKLNEEFDRMKNLIGYDRKTQ